jgi:hypothetical protein
MGSTVDYQQIQMEQELRLKEQTRQKALRVVKEFCKRYHWSEEEQAQVISMLGLTEPVRAGRTNYVMSFNYRVG